MKTDVTAENKPAYSLQINTGFTQRSRCMRRDAHEDQSAVHVFVIFLDKITIMIVSCALELVVELGARVTGSPEV